MNENLWLKSSFTIGKLPDWPCPTCSKGTLTLKKEHFYYDQTFESRNASDHEDWEPDWINYRFSGVLRCSNPRCQDFISFSGCGYPEHHHYFDYSINDYTEDYTDTFRPTYFDPPLHIIKIDEGYPEAIKTEIVDAFKLYWADYKSCANKIRVILEMIMNDRKVKRSFITKKGKRKQLVLHERIEEFKLKEPDVAEHLLAIKWIGNSGSHIGKISQQDLIDAFQLLEFSLEKLYDNKDRRMKKLASEISKKKGPRSGKK